MCGAKPLVTMNIPIVYRFRLCIENICPYLKVLEMLTVCHYKLFGDVFHEVRLFCYLTCVNGTSMLENSS